MTRERRCLIEIEDISALSYTCPHCRQEMSIPLDGHHFPKPRCPICGEQLGNTVGPYHALLAELRQVRSMTDRPVRLRFIVPDPE